MTGELLDVSSATVTTANDLARNWAPQCSPVQLDLVKVDESC